MALGRRSRAVPLVAPMVPLPAAPATASSSTTTVVTGAVPHLHAIVVTG